jgi:hypothetical protein
MWKYRNIIIKKNWQEYWMWKYRNIIIKKNWQEYWMWKYRNIIIKKKLTKILNVKIPKDKHNKIDRNTECENIGYRNSERIYDEWGWGYTTVFSFDIFSFDILVFCTFHFRYFYFWYFPFHTTWINPNHLNLIFFRDFWHDLHDQVAHWV